MRTNFLLRVFLPAALIVLAGWWVFSPAFHGDWLWDDTVDITQNQELHSPSALQKIWFAPGRLDYYPLKATVQWLQWRLWQTRPFGYHLTNVGLHLVSALLLWRLFGKLGLRPAWLGGLLLALHPVVVESVAWIAELKNTLSLPLLLLAMGAWLDFDERKRRADCVRSLLLFLAAMLCKSSVVMFPVVLLLHAWWKRGRITRTDGKRTVAFFAVSLVLGLVTVWFQHHRAIGSGIVPMGGFFSRLACAGLALVFYFSKCVLPAGLLPLYPPWTVNPPALLQFLPWLLIGAMTCGLWTRRATWGRHALFGGGFFVVNLAPMLGFIPVSYMRFTWVMDHFVYVPLLGLIGLAVAGIGRTEARLSTPGRACFFAGTAMIFGLFAFQSHRYAGIFRNEETLWTYTVQRNPSAWLAHNNLGNSLLQSGRLAEAIGHYEATVRLNPGFASGQSNLAYALTQAGRLPEAIAHFEEALRLSPDNAQTHSNFGLALVQAGRLPEAIWHYQEALRLNPELVEVHYNLGSALLQANRTSEALRHYQAAVRLQPGSAEAHCNLGNVLLPLGRLPEAIREYRETLRLKPGLAEVHNALGSALLAAGQPEEAIEHFAQASRLNPGLAKVHGNWGNALVRLGRLPEAVIHFEQCLWLRPDLPEVHDRVGTVLANLGRFEEAMAHFKEALRLKPDYAEARQHLEIVRRHTAPPPAGPGN